MGAGGWGSGGQITGFVLVGVVWAIAIPLFFYWDRANHAQLNKKSVNSV
jgi:hypothetical protein